MSARNSGPRAGRVAEYLTIMIMTVSVAACGGVNHDTGGTPMDAIAERYVKLVLHMGTHDAAYVDAYYGPSEWSDEVAASQKSLVEVRAAAEALLSELAAISFPAEAEELIKLRHAYLTRQLQSVTARIDMLEGTTLTFDEEAGALYDADPPLYDASHFQAIVDAVSDALPEGDGPIHERYRKFRESFVIPPEKLDAVFSTAIEECRRRTAAYMQLPAGESFTVEYVTDKPWSGYNWYQGGSKSLIQVNTDLPIHIDRAVDLACHEGYPGHHVYNAMLESELARKRGWVEVMVYALFSPQSLIAEGTANYGIDMAFPGEERQAYERDVLFPLAGLDTNRVDQYYKVLELAGKLDYARNEAARAYLNGEIDADSAAAYLNRYALMDDARAAQSVRFIDTYRSYVINYNLGKDLVREYVEREAGEGATAEQRWAVYGELLSSPRLPSGLR